MYILVGATMDEEEEEIGWVTGWLVCEKGRVKLIFLDNTKKIKFEKPFHLRPLVRLVRLRVRHVRLRLVRLVRLMRLTRLHVRRLVRLLQDRVGRRLVRRRVRLHSMRRVRRLAQDRGGRRVVRLSLEQRGVRPGRRDVVPLDGDGGVPREVVGQVVDVVVLRRVARVRLQQGRVVGGAVGVKLGGGEDNILYRVSPKITAAFFFLLGHRVALCNYENLTTQKARTKAEAKESGIVFFSANSGFLIKLAEMPSSPPSRSPLVQIN